MLKLVLQVTLGAVIGLCSGCGFVGGLMIQFPQQYLEPSSSEGSTGVIAQPPRGAPPVLSCCRNQHNSIYLVREDVRILVHATRDCITGPIGDRLKRDGFTIYIAFQVPENKQLEIPQAVIGVGAGNVAGYRQGELRTASTYSGSGPVIGSTQQQDGPSGKDVVHKLYPTFAQFSLPEAESYRVILPAIRVNGIETRLPEVTFTKKSSIGGAQLNRCWW